MSIERMEISMKTITKQMKIILWGIMLLIGLMLTVSFIAMAMDAENMVKIVKEKNNVTVEHSPQFPLFPNKK
jgi:hypothetical protein